MIATYLVVYQRFHSREQMRREVATVSGHGQTAKAAALCLPPMARSPISMMPITPIRERVAHGLVRAKVVVAIRWVIGIRREHVVRRYRCVVAIVR